MINTDFMPSRSLAAYMVKLFLTRSFAVLVALVLTLMMLDLLGESGKILAVEGNSEIDLWRYAAYRMPLLVAQFLPFSVLLGTLIMFTGLNQHSEIVAMKSSGLSAHQILAPLMIAAFGVAAVLFAFNQVVTVDAARFVNAWSANDYEPLPPESDIVSDVWVREGETLIHADHAIGRGEAFRLQGVTLHVREGGSLQRVVEIEAMRPDGDAWAFEGVSSYDAEQNLVRESATGRGLEGVEAARFRLAKVDPEAEDIFELRDTIEALDAAGRTTAAAKAGWWHKISSPLSTVLMPLLAAIAAFGLARSGQVLARAAIGMSLGFAYFVADNFSLAMGNVGAYPPWLAAWGPFFLFFLIGESVLIRSEE